MTADDAQSVSPEEIDALEASLEDDQHMQEILEQMATKTCDYCQSLVTWMDPFELGAADPQSYDELIEREGIDHEDVFMAWDCPECSNFSLMGDDFEVQWLDIPTFCPACDSNEVDVLDPAQVAHIDRARYLELKKQFGVQTLLAGDAVQCDDCKAISFLPATP